MQKVSCDVARVGKTGQYEHVRTSTVAPLLVAAYGVATWCLSHDVVVHGGAQVPAFVVAAVGLGLIAARWFVVAAALLWLVLPFIGDDGSDIVSDILGPWIAVVATCGAAVLITLGVGIARAGRATR